MPVRRRPSFCEREIRKCHVSTKLTRPISPGASLSLRPREPELVAKRGGCLGARRVRRFSQHRQRHRAEVRQFLQRSWLRELVGERDLADAEFAHPPAASSRISSLGAFAGVGPDIDISRSHLVLALSGDSLHRPAFHKQSKPESRAWLCTTAADHNGYEIAFNDELPAGEPASRRVLDDSSTIGIGSVCVDYACGVAPDITDVAWQLRLQYRSCAECACPPLPSP